MKKFAILFAAASTMALAACGGTPANETANASNEVMENAMDNSAMMMENSADNAMMGNAMENAAM